MLLLDTNAVSALLMGEPGIRELLNEDARHAIPVMVVGEYRFGLLRSRSKRQLEPLLDRLILESELIIVDEVTTHHYAVVREGLRRKGKPLPENDVWIGALAIQHRLEVASLDKHFDEIAGLVRHDW